MAIQTTVEQEFIRIENAKKTLAEKAASMGLYYTDDESSMDIDISLNDDGTPKDQIEDIAEAYDNITVYDTQEKRTNAIGLQGIQVVVEPGYYPTYAYKMQTEVDQAEPVISVDKDTGLITATSTQVGGFVAGGTKTVEQQISHPDLIADNIKTGKSVFGIDGTYTKVDGSDGKMPVEGRFMVNGYSGFVNGERVDGSATNFNAIEENIDIYYEENGELKQTTSWTLEEGFVKNVSLVFNDAALLNRLKAI